MDPKKQNNYSIFCCFCEETRRKRKNNQIPSINNNDSNHKNLMRYEIDTNSNISSKLEKDKKTQNSMVPLTKPNNDNTISFKTDENNISIKKSINNDNKNISNLYIQKEKIIKNDKTTNNSYYTVNENIQKLIDKNKLSKNEENDMLKRNKSISLEKLPFNLDNIEKNKENKENNNNLSYFNEKNNKEKKKSSNDIKTMNPIFPNNFDNIINMKNINENNKEAKTCNNLNLNQTFRNIRKNVKVFEFEDEMSIGQLINQNKSNLNKSITSNLGSKNVQIQLEEEAKNNIINISKENSNNININKLNGGNDNKNNCIKINNQSNSIVLLDKNEYCINSNYMNNNKNILTNNSVINNLLSPRSITEEEIIRNSNCYRKEKENNDEIERKTENQNEKNNNIEINDNLIISINEGQNDTNPNIKINNLNTNPINISNKQNSEKNKNIENIENMIATKREDSKNNILNEINKEETINNNYDDDNNSENSKDFFYKTVKIKKNKNNFFILNNENEENDLEDFHLNYLTEFYSTARNENKSEILNDEKEEKNIKGSDKKTEKENKIEKDEEDEKDNEENDNELDDEVGSIDEFHNTNDNRSILSSYIFTSVHITENKSISQSICTKSDFQDATSNYNDIASSKGGLNLIPRGMISKDSKEFEIKFDKGMNIIPCINGIKNNQIHYGMNNFLSLQINNSIKKMKDKINDKDLLIKKNNDNIDNMKKKIKKIDEESKQYERWIEKEEDENQRLTYILNYLMEN